MTSNSSVDMDMETLQRRLEQATAELQHAHRALAACETALKRSQEVARVGHWTWDTRTNRVTWSAGMFQIFGVDPATFDGDLDAIIQRTIHPNDLPKVMAANTAVIQERRPGAMSYRVVWPDGSMRRVWAAPVERVEDEQGNIVQLSGFIQDRTEHTKAEEDLQLQSAALAAAGNAIVITALDGSIEWVNPAFTQLTGYTAAESVGRKLGDLQRSGLQSPTFYEELWSAILAGRVWQGELVNRRKDGSLYSEEQTITPVLDDGGAVTHFVAVKQDISARRQHEREMEAVIAVSAALRAVTTRAELLPVIVDQLQTLFAADGAAAEVLDAAGEHLVVEISRGIWASVAGAAIPRDHGLSVQVLANGAAYLNNAIQQEGNLLYPELLRSIQAVAGAPLVAQGKAYGALWIASRQTMSEHDLRVLAAIADITSSALLRVDLYERTQQQAEEMAQIMRSVPDGVLLLDAQHRVVTGTPRAQQYLETAAGVSVGAVLTHLGDRPLAELLTSPPAGQHHLVSAAGRTFEVATRPVEAGPAANGWVLVIRDVTKEIAAQEQMQRRERLAAIGQLAAGIAHDFNNIMSVITVYTQLLEAMPETGEQARERLQIIDRQAMRATDMIRQILDFSRRSVMERQAVDLLPLLSEHVKLIGRTLPENIEVLLTHSGGPFVVHADPTRLAQAVMNLSINARDAMPEGGKLTFHLDYLLITTPKSAPLPSMGIGEWVRLTVADTGVGMAPAALQHLFEPFYTTKEPGRGTGLGLPQVHGIVGQHGGHIHVESQEGTGTQVIIYLPAVHVAAGGAPLAHLSSELPQGHGETLLLVEDEPVLRESISDLLTQWNYRVLKVANGQQALDILSSGSEPVALVLTDIVMPVMGGIGLLKQMRGRSIDTPVVILTGHPLRDEVEGLQRFGVAAWLNKPPSTLQLAHTLAQVLEG